MRSLLVPHARIMCTILGTRENAAQGQEEELCADAQVFDVSKGQQIKGVDFKVQALTQRTVQVRVRWPNGKPAEGAYVCVAYERTKEYESLESTNGTRATDQDGNASLHLYGASRVRVFAEQFVSNPKKNRQDTYHSRRFESAANKIPAEIDLVLASSKP